MNIFIVIHNPNAIFEVKSKVYYQFIDGIFYDGYRYERYRYNKNFRVPCRMHESSICNIFEKYAIISKKQLELIRLLKLQKLNEY